MEHETEPDILAGRFNRLIASTIDCLIIAFPMMLFIWLIASLFDLTFDVENKVVDPVIYVVGFICSLFLYFLINYKKLRDEGQTLGKEIMGSKITDLNGQLLPVQSLIVKRLIPFWLFPYLPFIGGIANMVNLLFIFGKPRRCIHDYIAGTKVIMVNKANQPGAS